MKRFATILLFGLFLLIPINIWLGYFPKYVGDYHNLPPEAIKVMRASPAFAGHTVPLRDEKGVEGSDLVSVLLLDDYEYAIAGRVARANLGIIFATLVAGGFSLLLDRRRGKGAF